jgi:hypothetical protein
MQTTIAAAPAGAPVYIENRGLKSVGPMLYQARTRFPGWAGVFAIYFRDHVVDGKRVYFLEADPLVIEGARDGRRTAGLMLSYADVGRVPPPPEPPPRSVARPGAAATTSARR